MKNNVKKLINFFKSKELKLPSNRDNTTNFDNYLNELFENHKRLVRCLSKLPRKSTKKKVVLEKFSSVSKKKNSEQNILNIENYKYIINEIKKGKIVSKKISKGILRCLEKYFNGRVSDAYGIFKKTLDDKKVLNYFKKLISNDVKKDSEYSSFSDLYRVTATNEDLSQNPLRLFHVPYNLREKIGTNRYSIPGFPCLYLGGAAELCWRELKSPKKEKLYITKYNVISDKLRFLNFGYTPQFWGKLLSNPNDVIIALRKDLIVAHAVCWPLIAACSIIRKDPKSKFAPEYVIPQMLLQWIMESKNNKEIKEEINGIRFFSTKSLKKYIAIKSNVNYILPAIKSNDDNFYSSNLAKKFKIAKPILINKKNGSYFSPEDESKLKNDLGEPLMDIINNIKK